MEQAKEQAEVVDASTGSSPDFVSSPVLSSPAYTASSPVYTASSPVYGQAVVAPGPGQLSYGAMAMGAEGQTPSPVSSPMVRLGNVLTPVQMVQPTSPMYTSIITPSPEQSPQSSILEVKAPEKKDSSDDGGGGQAGGSKIVNISASALS